LTVTLKETLLAGYDLVCGIRDHRLRVGITGSGIEIIDLGIGIDGKTWIRIQDFGIKDQNIDMLGSGIDVSGS